MNGVKNHVKYIAKNDVKDGMWMREIGGRRVISVPTLRPTRPVSRHGTVSRSPGCAALADEINKLLGNRQLRLIHRRQLRDSAQSIPANIREGMGRTPGPHRNQAYRDARGSAEEMDEHLRANFADGRLAPATFWQIHNRIARIVKMLTTIIDA